MDCQSPGQVPLLPRPGHIRGARCHLRCGELVLYSTITPCDPAPQRRHAMYEPDVPIGRIGGLAAVLVLLLTTASCKDGNAEEEKAAEEAAVPVEVQAIDRGDVAAVYSGTAALEA